MEREKRPRRYEVGLDQFSNKIIHYKAEHQRLLDEEVAPTLHLALPQDIAINNVLPFLGLPPHTFDGEITEVGGWGLGR